MSPKSRATKRQGSLSSFDSFRVSKPIAKSNLKNVKAPLQTDSTKPKIHTIAKEESKISTSDAEDVTTTISPALSKEASSEAPVERPQLDERAAKYIHAAEAILDTKQTAILHTNPNTIEIILRDFDLTGKYGPCVGLTRLARYERAVKMGMEPPPEVGEILLTQQAHEKSEYKNDLFYGRL